jgi:hypothetical protein
MRDGLTDHAETDLCCHRRKGDRGSQRGETAKTEKRKTVRKSRGG